MTKKLLAALLALIMVFSLVACGSSSSSSTSSDADDSADTTAADDADAEDAADADADAEDADAAADADASDEAETVESYLAKLAADGYTIPSMTLTCATQASETNSISITSRLFIDKVTEYTDGAVTFDEYFNAQLGAGTDQLTTIGSGIADCGDIVTLYFTSDLLLSQITYCMPFSPSDPKTAADIMNDFVELYPEVLEETESNGVYTLFYKGIESYDIFGTVEINSIYDLDGNRFCVGGIYYSPWFQALGAVPMSSTIATMYQDYKNNVNDSGLQYASSWVEYSLYEVAPYWCQINMGSRACHIFGFNLDTWNSLDEEMQELFQLIADEVYIEYHEWLSSNISEWADYLTNETDMIITTISDEEKEEWVQLIFDYQDTIQMWIDDADAAGYDGAQMISDFLQIAESYGHEWPFDSSRYLTD